MKKILSIILAVVTMFGMLTACGSDVPKQESSTSETGRTEESRESSAENEQNENTVVTKVVYWNSDSGEKVFLDEITEEFNATVGKENNVELVMEHIENGNYTQQLSVAFQNGVQPDIFACTNDFFTESVEKGYLMPLNEVEDLKDLVEKNGTVRLVGSGGNVWQDGIYRIPVNTRVLGLAYNKDMFVAAGIVDEKGEAKPPVTIAEMVEDAKILTDTGKQQFGICFPLAWSACVNYYLGLPSQSVSGMVNGNYDYKTGLYDFEGMRDMAEAFLQMKEDGSIYPGAESLDNDPARARFAEGSIGMMMTAQWDCSVWNEQFPAKCKWGVAPIPVTDQDVAYQQYANCTFSYAIAAKGFEEERGSAISLVYNYLYSDEMLIRRCEEGKSIPFRKELVEKCDFSNSPEGWGDYCNMISISNKEVYMAKQVNLDGLDNFSDEFINNVWSGKKSLDEWITDMTERYNEGAERYIENSAEDVVALMMERMDPNFDISR